MKKNANRFFCTLLHPFTRHTEEPALRTKALSQRETVLAHLRRGEELTTTEAIERYGCLRLSARIRELRVAGYPIVTRRFRGCDGKHLAAYRHTGRDHP